MKTAIGIAILITVLLALPHNMLRVLPVDFHMIKRSVEIRLHLTKHCVNNSFHDIVVNETGLL
jgi:hypothetical protein